MNQILTPWANSCILLSCSFNNGGTGSANPNIHVNGSDVNESRSLMVLLICSPFNQACCLFHLLDIFWSAWRPSHHRRYHWGRWSRGEKAGDLGIEMVFDIQLILGFHLCSHDIPKITCCWPTLGTMRSWFLWIRRRECWCGLSIQWFLWCWSNGFWDVLVSSELSRVGKMFLECWGKILDWLGWSCF